MNLLKSSILISVLFLFPLNIYSRVSRGIVKEGLLVQSKNLKKEVRYAIYLPVDYETSYRYYPVVCLLHGYTDNDMDWIQFGEANMSADEAIAESVKIFV